MKNAIVKRIIIIVAAALVLLMTATVIVVWEFSKRSAEDNALNLLYIFEENIKDNSIETPEDFEKLVKLSGDAKNVRISIIALNGDVIADTFTANPKSLEDHSGRPKVKTAIEGGIGTDIRKSESFNNNYFYVCKKVNTLNSAVILRIAVPVAAIDFYLWPLIAAMAGIIILTLIVVILISPKMAKSIIAPVAMIKAKLDTVGKPEDSIITLTRYDEINQVLIEIDEISEKLNSNLISFEKEKDKLNFVLENINFAILVLDENNRVILSNRIAKDYFGFEDDGASVDKIIRNLNLTEYIHKAVQNKEFVTFDIDYAQADILEIKLLPIHSSEIQLIVTAQTVTDIRKLQKEKQDFFINASHELSTPLSSILGYTEILRKEKKFNSEFVETIYKQTERMRALIADMLRLSELEEGTEIPEENVDLKETAEGVVSAYKPKAESKQITLKAELESLTVRASKEKITEIMSNLIDNSIKYTNEGGEVILRVRKQKNKAILSVKDNGIGIAQKHLSRICERFYRTDKGRSRAEGGTGLGLAIVKHICNYYKASLTINSKENIGTEIVIQFPLKN